MASEKVDRKATLRFLEQREAERQKRLDEAFDRALADFERIVELIINDFTPSEIWQWGSLLDRRRFSEISDIDIAVEGLGSPQKIFNLLRRAEELTNFELDVVELERIEPEFERLIRQKGKKVYERPR